MKQIRHHLEIERPAPGIKMTIIKNDTDAMRNFATQHADLSLEIKNENYTSIVLKCFFLHHFPNRILLILFYKAQLLRSIEEHTFWIPYMFGHRTPQTGFQADKYRLHEFLLPRLRPWSSKSLRQSFFVLLILPTIKNEQFLKFFRAH